MFDVMQQDAVAMSRKNDHAIPAANIGDTDLDAIERFNPTAAKEIARLEGLMNRGDDSKEDFLRLCQLLFDVGSVAAAEILLRRNLACYDGKRRYTRLFGTEKPDEFDAAIQVFESQFHISLLLTEEADFLVATFHSQGGPQRSDEFQLLSRPCEIKIGYIEQDKIEADVVLLDPDRVVFNADECLFMYLVNDVWEITDPLTA